MGASIPGHGGILDRIDSLDLCRAAFHAHGRLLLSSAMKRWHYSPAADLDQTVVERLRNFPREPDMLVYGLRSLVALIIRGLLRTYHRFEIVGAENLRDDRSFVLVANHSSHLDTVCLLAGLPIAPIASRLSGGGRGLFFPKRPAHLDRVRGRQCLALRAARPSPPEPGRSAVSCSRMPATFSSFSRKERARRLARCRNSNAASARSWRAAMSLCSPVIWRARFAAWPKGRRCRDRAKCA